MASRIPQMQSKVAQASAAVSNHGSSYYKLLMEQNKHYIQEPPTVEKCQSLAKQLFYTRLARYDVYELNPYCLYCELWLSVFLSSIELNVFFCSIPHRYNVLRKELDYAKNIMKNKQDLNLESASYAALFGLECFAWFCGGEIVGRGFTITGYYV